MRPFTALAFAVLSLSCFVTAISLDPQVILQGKELIEDPRWSYSICDVGEDALVDIQSIGVVPDPPEPGKNLTVKVKAETGEIIKNGAYADVTVKLGLIKLLKKEIDLCEEARKANATVQCPVEPGPYEIQQTVALPKEIPRAKFSVHIEAFGASDEFLFCLDLVADFRWRFPHRL